MSPRIMKAPRIMLMGRASVSGSSLEGVRSMLASSPSQTVVRMMYQGYCCGSMVLDTLGSAKLPQ